MKAFNRICAYVAWGLVLAAAFVAYHALFVAVRGLDLSGTFPLLALYGQWLRFIAVPEVEVMLFVLAAAVVVMSQVEVVAQDLSSEREAEVDFLCRLIQDRDNMRDALVAARGHVQDVYSYVESMRNRAATADPEYLVHDFEGQLGRLDAALSAIHEALGGRGAPEPFAPVAGEDDEVDADAQDELGQDRDVWRPPVISGVGMTVDEMYGQAPDPNAATIADLKAKQLKADQLKAWSEI